MSQSQLPHCSENEKHTSIVNVNTKLDDIFDFISHNDLDRKITETSPFNEYDNRCPFNGDLIRCYALNPQENCFGIRANTILSYCTINQQVRFSMLHLSFSFIFLIQTLLELTLVCDFLFVLSTYRFSICGKNYFQKMHRL